MTQTHTVRITWNGGDWSLYFDGTQVQNTVTDTTYTTGAADSFGNDARNNPPTVAINYLRVY